MPGAAGREDDVGLLHDRVGQLQGGHVDPGDDVLGCAGRHRRLQHHTGRLDGTLLGTGMGADDDAVAGFQGEEGLENGGRGGVGGGDDAATTPMGSAIFCTPKAGSLSSTPQVLVFLYWL